MINFDVIVVSNRIYDEMKMDITFKWMIVFFSLKFYSQSIQFLANDSPGVSSYR